MSLGIRRISELTRDEAPGSILRYLLCLFYSSAHAFCALREHKLSSVCLEQIPALFTHSIRHCKYHAVTLGLRCTRQTYARVAAGRLYYRAARSQPALSLGALYHLFSYSIL